MPLFKSTKILFSEVSFHDTSIDVSAHYTSSKSSEYEEEFSYSTKEISLSW